MRKKTKEILWVLSIMAACIVAIITVLNWAGIEPNGNLVKIWADPFQISVSPNSINGGQWDEYPFIVEIIPNSQLNITSFELQKENLIIERLNKNSQTMVSSGFCLDNKYSSYPDCNFDFYFKCPSYSWGNENCNKKYEKSLILRGCQNCFYGSSFPYQFTFNIIYSEDGVKKTFTKRLDIPILN